VDLAGVVARVANRFDGKASARGVVLESDVVGDTTAEVDPVLLGQAMWNLLENAIRFTPTGGRVRVSIRGGADYVDVIVEDSGPGFPEEALDRVFDRFFRGDPARSRPDDVSGTGLGLAIVKGIAEAHDGHVEAGKAPGGGARVTVRFPRRSQQTA
jgi:signal transduction histidine kinase